MPADLWISLCRQLDPILDPEATPQPLAVTASISGGTSGTPSQFHGLLASSLGSAGASQGPTASPVGADTLAEEAEGPYQPKLSKHEKQLMQQAHERHQANITTKQVLLCQPLLLPVQKWLVEYAMDTGQQLAVRLWLQPRSSQSLLSGSILAHSGDRA